MLAVFFTKHEGIDMSHVNHHMNDVREQFYKGCVEAMLWSTSGDDDEESLEGYEITQNAELVLRSACITFIHMNYPLLVQYAKQRAQSLETGCSVWEHAGHDFWLTQAGHGTGFWDRGLGELGDDLTEACETFRNSFDPYPNADDIIDL